MRIENESDYNLNTRIASKCLIESQLWHTLIYIGSMGIWKECEQTLLCLVLITVTRKNSDIWSLNVVHMRLGTYTRLICHALYTVYCKPYLCASYWTDSDQTKSVRAFNYIIISFILLYNVNVKKKTGNQLMKWFVRFTEWHIMEMLLDSSDIPKYQSIS